MSAVVTPRRRAPFLLALALAGVASVLLSGCGEEKAPDPYVYATLRAVTRGDTLSTDFLYEIDAPQFEYVRGPVGMVRDGNLLEFLVGDDLENRYTSLSGTLLGVQKTFTPQPTHLVLRRIKRNGVVVEDSLPKPEYTLPHLLRASVVDLETPGAPLPDIQWNRPASLEQFLPEEEGDDLLQIQSGIEKLVYMPRHDLPDSAKVNPSPKDMAWYAVFPDASLLIEDLMPGADWMLHLLHDKGYPLVGSFSVKSLYDFRQRREEYPEIGHVVGTMKINWFRFGNTFVEGSTRE